MSAPNVAPGGSSPHYVLATRTDATTVLRRLAREGWRTREGFSITGQGADLAGGRLVLFGRVTDLNTAQLVVRAAERGAAVVAVANGPVRQFLLADLGRLGTVGHGPEEARDESAPVPLLPEQRALLQRLANGETIASAAAAEFLSLRTANRRIAQARQVLGVSSTREAVRAYLRGRDD